MSPQLVPAVKFARRLLRDGTPEMHIREHFLRHEWPPALLDIVMREALRQRSTWELKKERIVDALQDLWRAIWL